MKDGMEGRTQSVRNSMLTALQDTASVLTYYSAAVPCRCSQLLRSSSDCRVSDGCCMSLFKRAIRTSFSPEGVNRRVNYQNQKRPAPADGLQAGKRRAEGHISTKQVTIDARASRVNQSRLYSVTASKLCTFQGALILTCNTYPDLLNIGYSTCSCSREPRRLL